ncbi:MAG: dTMP kinase [Thermoplasmataceae archaeon]
MFVAIEGIDGSGKTFLASGLARAIADLGHSVYLTREPTQRMKRDAALERSRDPLDAMKLFFDFTIDRISHQKEILLEMSRNEIVISDRYLYSSLAYQGVLIEGYFKNKGEAMEWMDCINRAISVRPDINIILDIEPRKAMERIRRRDHMGGFEDEAFLRSVRDRYLLIRNSKDIVINAENPPDAVIKEALGEIKRIMRW